MKKDSSSKKIGTVFSFVSALIVAILFWLVVKYVDGSSLTANVCSGVWGGIL